VRKVVVVAIEVGLEPQIERIATNATPLNLFEPLARENPLSKVPALVTDDGVALFDSRVICEYLDSLHSGRKLFPEGGRERWTALRQQALADGIMDAAVAWRYETALRPLESQWQPWSDGQLNKVRSGLDALEAEHDDLAGDLNIGQIAVACTLGWLQIRLSEDWRASRPALSDWFDRISDRPSMRATVPPGGSPVPQGNAGAGGNSRFSLRRNMEARR
jgi:glutathione S-transferase